METYVRQVIEGVSNTRGKDFFNAITLRLGDILSANYTFIARIDRDRHVSSTIALVANGQLVDNFEYDLQYTPCENVADDSVCCYAKDVQHYFPKDQLLIDMGIDGYLGSPLHDSNGVVMGIIVALYDRPIENENTISTLFQIFSGRIAAEMERVEYEKKLVELNNTLEKRVEDRTKELENTLTRLQDTQEQLIESEKLASLGNLVAGVAHEVNTPLGVAITAQSVLNDEFTTLTNKIDNDDLSMQDMDHFRASYSEAMTLLNTNLNRSKELISSFKKTAADQNYLELEEFKLHDYYELVLSTLSPVLRSANIVYTTDIPEQFTLVSYPGIHAQLISNLVNNTALHAFDDQSDIRSIHIHAEEIDNEHIKITYSDNGKGLTEDIKEKVFEPFFTTARNRGGTGLGMSIVYNLVNKNLEGKVALPNSDKGFSLEIVLPKTLHKHAIAV